MPRSLSWMSVRDRDLGFSLFGASWIGHEPGFRYSMDLRYSIMITVEGLDTDCERHYHYSGGSKLAEPVEY